MLAAHATPSDFAVTPAAAADLSSSALSFVMPLGTAAPADGRPRARKRGQSAAMAVAETAVSGVLKQAGPPGAYGVRTLWAMCLGLWVLWLLRALLAALWS